MSLFELLKIVLSGQKPTFTIKRKHHHMQASDNCLFKQSYDKANQIECVQKAVFLVTKLKL